MRAVVLLVAALAASCLASFGGRRVDIEGLHGKRAPAGWRCDMTRVVPSTWPDEVIVLLRQQSLERLEATLRDVSNPKSANWGKWLSREQITGIVAPKRETIRAVTAFLRAAGVSFRLTPNRDMIRLAPTPTHVVEQLFDLKLKAYVHTSGAVVFTSAGGYTVPAELAPHIDFVSGLVNGFPNMQVRPSFVQAAGRRRDGDKDKDIDPVVIRARYNVTGIGGKAPQNSHGVAEFQAQYYSPDDLTAFFKRFVPYASPQTVSKVIGTNDAKDPGLEASLDVQYQFGISPNTTSFFYSMKSSAFYSDLTKYQAELASESDPAIVQSISYGSQGDYPSRAYIERADVEWQKIGARGLTIIIASGDDGAGCQSNEDAKCVIDSSYPAVSPWVLSVGATAFINGNSGSEKAVELFLSGGGFSRFHPMPDWQSDAVGAYLRGGSQFPPASSFNASNRATPDVSALGDEYFEVIQAGKVVLVGGTSASTPTFAAVVTLLNDERMAQGMSSLGYINPWIYQTWAATKDSRDPAFFDVTIGDNVCQRIKVGNKMVSCGFYTAPGYDAVTGLGTPNFRALLAAALAN